VKNSTGKIKIPNTNKFIYTDVIDYTNGTDYAHKVSTWKELDSLILYQKNEMKNGGRKYFTLFGQFDTLGPTLFISGGDNKNAKSMYKIIRLKIFRRKEIELRDLLTVELKEKDWGGMDEFMKSIEGTGLNAVLQKDKIKKEQEKNNEKLLLQFKKETSPPHHHHDDDDEQKPFVGSNTGLTFNSEGGHFDDDDNDGVSNKYWDDDNENGGIDDNQSKLDEWEAEQEQKRNMLLQLQDKKNSNNRETFVLQTNKRKRDQQTDRHDDTTLPPPPKKTRSAEDANPSKNDDEGSILDQVIQKAGLGVVTSQDPSSSKPGPKKSNTSSILERLGIDSTPKQQQKSGRAGRRNVPVQQQ